MSPRTTAVRRVLLAAALLVTAPHALCGDEGKYFPDTGPGALRQQSLELLSGAVVCSIALEPGSEDLPTLSALRMKEGARVISVFVTNGDATPSELSADAPFLVAAQRKEEADRASALTGALPYFLNIPDPGIVQDGAALESVWIPDTVVARLKAALLTFRPDVILIARDFRESGRESMRRRLLLRLASEAVSRAEVEDRRAGRGDRTPWRAASVFAESPVDSGRIAEPVDAIDPAWGVSYREIAREAAACYQTLAGSVLSRIEVPSRSYEQILPGGRRVRSHILEGVPALPARLRSVRESIARALGKSLAPSLARVSAAIDAVNHAIVTRPTSPGGLEDRLLADWLSGLERVRCNLLGVRVRWSVPDSLVAPRQLFTVRFLNVGSSLGHAKMQIMFPGASAKGWIINEKIQDDFPLESRDDFSIVTPMQMEFNAPTSMFGLRRHDIWSRLPFIIYHRDANRERNFAYYGSIRLKVGPSRTYEILTPIVRAEDGEPILLSFLDISREPFHGTVSLADSLLGAATRPVVLRGKNFHLIDTLFLHPPPTLSAGDYEGRATLSAHGGTRAFAARRFDAVTDSSRWYGVWTGMQSSPLTETLARLRLHYERLEHPEASGSWPLTGAVVVDQNATALARDARRMVDSLLHWVHDGGTLIVLRQPPGSAMDVLTAVDSVAFRSSDPLWPEAEVRWNTASSLMTLPNRIGAKDWRGWVVSRSWGSLHVIGRRDANIVVRSLDTGSPLVVSSPEGKGRIIDVALDVSSQFLNVNPGAFRLLANLLASR